MKARTRFLKSVISAAKSDTTEMPWTRGAPRQARLNARRIGSDQRQDTLRLKRA
ncbi:hypothetical protein [Pseudophaeobacter sp.]|uniref:hypothetical protein n=1 Tax=Pseudophaeobacter sp. TaxID=1971739 RepID=UPI00405A4B06